MSTHPRRWALGDILVDVREDGTFALPKTSRPGCVGYVYGCECEPCAVRSAEGGVVRALPAPRQPWQALPLDRAA
jgi:hypothetical protein